ncbi:MAG TPA: hypothetical protein PKK13_08590 [Spirochaetota bacterium]|jgi:hypothetical protein|nr:hypothetical protein [Spirochaetota bacterium]HQB60534.1 hypothetical protein [Spirochaetota bacterium]
MKKILFVTLIIIVILISLSMDCFKGTERRIDFSYDPEKAGADLISKTDLSKYVDSCNNVGIDFKDNKLYLASDKKVFQFNSNNLTLENAYNISLDVTYDYNITSITHDDNYFYILANEYDNTKNILRNYVLKNIDINNISNIYSYENVSINKIMKIRYDKVINTLFSLMSIAPYHPEDYFISDSEYYLYIVTIANNLLSLFKIGSQNSFSRDNIQSFCYYLDRIIISKWGDDGELGISGSINCYNDQDYYNIWDTKSASSIDTSYLGDDDFVCIYDMVFDGTYLWCLVNDDDKDAYITGGGTPYLLKLKPRWRDY